VTAGPGRGSRASSRLDQRTGQHIAPSYQDQAGVIRRHGGAPPLAQPTREQLLTALGGAG
jgi:hypothetical protein